MSIIKNYVQEDNIKNQIDILIKNFYGADKLLQWINYFDAKIKTEKALNEYLALGDLWRVSGDFLQGYTYYNVINHLAWHQENYYEKMQSIIGSQICIRQLRDNLPGLR